MTVICLQTTGWFQLFVVFHSIVSMHTYLHICVICDFAQLLCNNCLHQQDCSTYIYIYICREEKKNQSAHKHIVSLPICLQNCVITKWIASVDRRLQSHYKYFYYWVFICRLETRLVSTYLFYRYCWACAVHAYMFYFSLCKYIGYLYTSIHTHFNSKQKKNLSTDATKVQHYLFYYFIVSCKSVNTLKARAHCMHTPKIQKSSWWLYYVDMANYSLFANVLGVSLCVIRWLNICPYRDIKVK